MFLIQVATESACPNPQCPSPVSRSWAHSLYLTLVVPKDLERGELVTLETLLDNFSRVDLAPEASLSCGYDKQHPKRLTTTAKLTKLSEIVVMRLDRSTVREYIDEHGSRVQVPDNVLNQILLQETFDFSKYIDQKLPSEQGDVMLPSASVTANTIYTLTGVVRYQKSLSHYLTFSKIEDSNGEQRWIMQDSLDEAPPEWDRSPFQTGDVDGSDCILVWQRNKLLPEPLDDDVGMRDIGDNQDRNDSPPRDNRQDDPLAADKAALKVQQDDLKRAQEDLQTKEAELSRREQSLKSGLAGLESSKVQQANEYAQKLAQLDNFAQATSDAQQSTNAAERRAIQVQQQGIDAEASKQKSEAEKQRQERTALNDARQDVRQQAEAAQALYSRALTLQRNSNAVTQQAEEERDRALKL